MQFIEADKAPPVDIPREDRPLTSSPPRIWNIGLVLLFAAILTLGILLRALGLGSTPLTGDEAESSMNAMTILQHGVPSGEYLGLPIYENTLTEFWPDNPEYEFRDSSYSKKGVAIYHGWLPLYSIAASFKAFGVMPDLPDGTNHVRRSFDEMKYRTMAARAPAVVFGAMFILFVFLTAYEMCGLDAAYAGMLIAAIGEPFVYFAREARYHSATLAVSTACCWIIWRIYKHRNWRDFILAGLLFVAMFHTHLISFVVVCCAMTLILPAILRHPKSIAKLLMMGAIVAAGTIPWLILTGFFQQTPHIPPARNFLSYPADLFIYPLKKIPDAIPGILALIWVLFIEAFKRFLPARITQPIIAHRKPIYFLLAWILIGFLAFTFLIPAASYFYKRMALGLLGPGLVFGAILFALVAREINERRSTLIAMLSFFIIVIAIRKAYFPWLEEPDPNGTYEGINWLATHDLAPDTKIYCAPNDQLTLTFLTGVPVQSIAPIRKSFIDHYPGRMVMIESSAPYQTLQIPDITRLAADHGQILSEVQAKTLQSSLSTRLQRIELASRCTAVSPPLEPATPFMDAVVEFQRQYTEIRQRHWMDNGANNPVMRGFDIPNFATWWPIFFYRFVDPLSRSGSHLNYTDRIKTAHADVTASGWVVFDCPPLNSEVK
ncbi:MAG TPA: glycosyltransferase family 39 protein [Tepidisphaeraceae bacterium]|jgi:hypothetical protein|nr:glycosyltransferase family 39 protein [Tepidisphaeraceae bacterium]